MSTPTPEQHLDTLWAEICDLDAAGSVLEWDQETGMPARGAATRAACLATLAGFKHRQLTSNALRDALDAADAAAEDGTLLAAKVRAARRLVDRAVKMPERLMRELAEARSAGLEAWRAAREADDFSPFAAPLGRLLDLRREQAACLLPSPDASPYDALLDGFEPGATEAELVPLFARLRAELTPLVRAVVESGVEVDESAAFGDFSIDGQRALGRRLAAAVGFDFDAGRLDLSTHPFCIGIGAGDVRMTCRFEDDDFRSGILGILHETGHGLYEQGIDHRRTPVGEATSLGIHESQSRLVENHIGRSRGFWSWALPQLHEVFPNASIPLDDLWPALHVVRPSLVRTEADEVTYNLHILVRFELERALLSGDLNVGELPAAWDDLYEDVLGVRAERPVDGVLQDIHWSMGELGYFPTYTLGNLIAAQLFEAAGRQLGDLEEAFAQGALAPLVGWLRERIHRPGAQTLAGELIEQATGAPLAPDALLAHLRATVAAVYGVESVQADGDQGGFAG